MGAKTRAGARWRATWPSGSNLDLAVVAPIVSPVVVVVIGSHCGFCRGSLAFALALAPVGDIQFSLRCLDSGHCPI